MTDKRMSLSELASLTELSRRTIRYYVQQELVAPPEGAGRGAFYTQAHLDVLLQIRKWQHAGLSLERIRELLNAQDDPNVIPPRPRSLGSVEVWSHIVVGDGLEVTLDPGRAGLSPEQVRAFAKRVKSAFEKTVNEGEQGS